MEWKAGRLAEARKVFLEIAEGSTLPGTAERARYLAAWIAEDEGDLAGATESYERLRGARDDSIRQEALFRFAYGLYLTGRHDEAIAAFEVGETGGGGTVERARHRYWKARALRDTGRGAEAAPTFADLAGDAFAGIYALFAVSARGEETFRFLNASSSGETKACGEERGRLWALNPEGGLGGGGRQKVRRAERLTLPGIEYAILEAERVDRAAMRKAIGMADGGTPGLFRYLAGDLGAASRKRRTSPSTRHRGLVDRIQYPLAPDYLGDCDRRSPASTPGPPLRHPPGVAFPVRRPLAGGCRRADAAHAQNGRRGRPEGKDAQTPQEGADATRREHPRWRGVPVTPGQGVRG